LGNPGREYAGTRHNVGAEAVALLARRHGGTLRKRKELSLVCEVAVDGQKLALAFPQTYMNESGRAVRRLVRRYGIEALDRLVVVHDEIDLPVGRVQVKEGGGLAGHNGLRSVKEHLHSAGFVRVRIGVGRPRRARGGAEHVLRQPRRAEREELEVSIEQAADAVEAIVGAGVGAAMNKFNRREPDQGPG